MKKKILTLTIMIACAAMVAVFCGTATAVVSGPCVNCHTMHDSQGGASMLFTADTDDLPNGALTRAGCMGCHAQEIAGVNIRTGDIPQVYHGGDDLAAGNFKYVVATDSKGHNVEGIKDADGTLTNTPPGYLAGYDPATTGYDSNNRLTCAGQNGCHGNRDEATDFAAVSGAHHADDSVLKYGTLATGSQGTSVATSYRFLYKVKGAEDSDWQNTTSGTDHNEYWGAPRSADRSGLSWATVDTISEFCAEGHGNFHASATDTGLGTASPWLRHPTDAVLPDSGGYASYNPEGANNYSLEAPVARPVLTDSLATANDTVTPGDSTTVNGALVACLSCHRAHASNYPDILRWDYDAMQASSGNDDTGCFVCHTDKNADLD